MNAFSGWRPFGGFSGFGRGDQIASDTSGSGAGNEDTTNNAGNNNPVQNGGQGQNNLELTDNIWEDKAAERAGRDNGDQGDRGSGSNNNNNNSSQNGGGTSPNAFSDYVNSLNFSPQMPQELQNQLAQGDYTGLSDWANSLGRNVFAQAVQGADRLIQARVDKAVQEAVSQSRASFQTQNFIDRMEARLDYTKDPNIAPVARSVLARFIQKGQTIDDAVQNVDKYFKAINNKLGGGSNRGNNGFSGGRPGSNGFRGGALELESGTGGNQGGEEDWVKFMTAS